jgi:putative ABC transport system substrate-binding protein
MQFDQLKRREFITLIGGAAATWPLAARAQQSGKVPTIGFLGQSTRSATSEWTTAFVQRLRELGWIDGRNLAIEYRWGEGLNERFAEIASELVRLKVDVIVTAGPPVFAVKQATSVIPIVFATVADPLGTGLVASLSKPGGNITGLSLTSPELAGKRLELMREAIPNLRRLAIMANAAEQVLFAALRMFHSQAAIARMTESLGVSPVDAESALAKLPKAAIAIAAEKRMAQFLQVANRIHFP